MKYKEKKVEHKAHICPGCGQVNCICNPEKTSSFKKAKKAKPKH